jgi:hypothetical protein
MARWGLFVALVAASPLAHADDGGAASTSSTEPARWYGAPALAIDAAGLGLVVTGRSVAGGGGAALGVAGEATMILVSPFNHGWHGRVDRVDSSALSRFGAAFLGVAAFLYFGREVNQCAAEHPLSYCRPLETALLVGPLAAMSVFDDVFRSWSAPRARSKAVGWVTPLVQVGEDRAYAGLAGVF